MARQKSPTIAKIDSLALIGGHRPTVKTVARQPRQYQAVCEVPGCGWKSGVAPDKTQPVHMYGDMLAHATSTQAQSVQAAQVAAVKAEGAEAVKSVEAELNAEAVQTPEKESEPEGEENEKEGEGEEKEEGE